MDKKNILLQLRTLLVYTIIFLLMIRIYSWMNMWVEEAELMLEFRTELIFITPIVMILFGIILSFERIYKIIKKEGVLSFNWLRLFVVVLPLSVISFFYVLYYSRILGAVPFKYFIQPSVMHAAQLLQGILLVTCFSKNSNDDKDVFGES